MLCRLIIFQSRNQNILVIWLLCVRFFLLLHGYHDSWSHFAFGYLLLSLRPLIVLLVHWTTEQRLDEEHHNFTNAIWSYLISCCMWKVFIFAAIQIIYIVCFYLFNWLFEHFVIINLYPFLYSSHFYHVSILSKKLNYFSNF